MTFTNAPAPRRSDSRKLWIAGVAALLALAVAGWVMFGGRGRPSSQPGGGPQAVRSAPVENAVEATPAAGVTGAGAFGGPGSAADGTGPAMAAQQAPASPQRSRPRRAARRQAERPAAAPPAPYEAIGPTVPDSEPPPQT